MNINWDPSGVGNGDGGGFRFQRRYRFYVRWWVPTKTSYYYFITCDPYHRIRDPCTHAQGSITFPFSYPYRLWKNWKLFKSHKRVFSENYSSSSFISRHLLSIPNRFSFIYTHSRTIYKGNTECTIIIRIQVQRRTFVRNWHVVTFLLYRSLARPLVSSPPTPSDPIFYMFPPITVELQK